MQDGDALECRTSPVTDATLEAVVSATASDIADVRSALDAWIGRAPTPEIEKERRAQLHLWLYRKGYSQELEKLKSLAAANPHLSSIRMFVLLAAQDIDEAWS